MGLLPLDPLRNVMFHILVRLMARCYLEKQEKKKQKPIEFSISLIGRYVPDSVGERQRELRKSNM